MNQLSIELSDAALEAIRKEAAETGVSPAGLIRELLERQFLTPPEGQRRMRVEDFFGSANLGYTLGADNLGIDEDLAKAYADTNEPT